MQRVKVTCTGTGCAEEQLLVPLAHLIVLCGCIRQMGQAKDRRLTRLRLPVAEFDSIEGGPHIPPRGAESDASKMFVVYQESQVYPEFVVTYRWRCTSDANPQVPTDAAWVSDLQAMIVAMLLLNIFTRMLTSQ